VSDGANVLFFQRKNGVFAYTHESKALWHANLGTNKHDWGTGASPVLFEDLVIVSDGQIFLRSDRAVYCIGVK
jgi:hypothetical protein